LKERDEKWNQVLKQAQSNPAVSWCCVWHFVSCVQSTL